MKNGAVFDMPGTTKIDGSGIWKMRGMNMPRKKSNTYEEFIDKFRVKKTTDDCYTPDNIYEVVADYVADTYKLDKTNFVRPFYPGGDYENYDYQDGDVVVDNPPFSIMSKILHFYTEKKIPCFLFANALTIFTSESPSYMCICLGVTIEYENTAKVSTSFMTNLEPAGARSDSKLYSELFEANKINASHLHQSVPKYSYPRNVLTANDIIKMSKYGVDFKVSIDDFIKISRLDSQRAEKKCIYGTGLLVSNAAAAAAANAAAAAAANAAAAAAANAAAAASDAIVWPLSDRELALIDELDAASGRAVGDEDSNRFEVM